MLGRHIYRVLDLGLRFNQPTSCQMTGRYVYDGMLLGVYLLLWSCQNPDGRKRRGFHDAGQFFPRRGCGGFGLLSRFGYW